MPAKAPTIGAAQVALLRKLCNAVAVSGDEAEVRKIVVNALNTAADELKVDVLGNVLITKKGKGAKRLRVMLDAHMDEVGFILAAEDGDGIYRFELIGGIDERNMVGKQVVVGKEHTPGVIGAKPIHHAKPEELKHPVPVDSLRIDLGPGGKAKVGDRGTFAPNFQRSGPSILSKSIDNRIGTATLIELVKAAPPNIDLLAAFTVQQEIGFRGAKVAAHYFNPDVAIVIDATPARDIPMQRPGENISYGSKLGLGPAIYVANPSAIDDPRLVRFMVETATKSKIPFQVRQPEGGGTNAGAIQRSGVGVPVVTVSVPHRYTQTAMSVARFEDWRNTMWLLLSALRSMTPAVLQRSNRP